MHAYTIICVDRFVIMKLVSLDMKQKNLYINKFHVRKERNKLWTQKKSERHSIMDYTR